MLITLQIFMSFYINEFLLIFDSYPHPTPVMRRCCFICLLQYLPSFAARFSRGLSDQGIEHLRNKFLLALGQLVDGFQLLLPFRSGATFTHSGFLLLIKQLFECGCKQSGQFWQGRYLNPPLAGLIGLDGLLGNARPA